MHISKMFVAADKTFITDEVPQKHALLWSHDGVVTNLHKFWLYV